MRRTVTALIACLFFLMSISNGTSHAVFAGEKIQEAIDRAEEGDIIEVHNGTYFESLNITKRISLLGLDRPLVDALGMGSAITLKADGVIVDGFLISNASQRDQAGIKVRSHDNSLKGNVIWRCFEGILLETSYYNNITNNNISDNIDDGIDIERGSCHNFISENLLADNGDDGLDLDENSKFNRLLKNTAYNNTYGISLDDGADNNIIDDNQVIDNVYGIELYLSKDNTLGGNNLSGNRYSFEALDEHYASHNHVFPSNLINGKPIYYLMGVSGLIIDSTTNASLIYCLDCTNLTIRDLTIVNTSIGINLHNVSNAFLNNNSIHLCEEDGIHICHCHNCSLQNNNISGNYNDGIHISESRNVTLLANRIDSNGYDGVDINSSSVKILENIIRFNQNSGVALDNAEDGTIHANEINGNKVEGLSIGGSDIIKIDGNVISRNARNGILLEGSKHISMNDNEIDRNGMAGIEMRSSMKNRVVNNTIMGNEFGISLYTSEGNLLLGNSGNENLDGIHLYQSSNNSVEVNDLTDNDLNGIYIGVLCQGNKVLGNNISGSRDGLGVQSSSNITLEKNRISNVLHEGICLDETAGSRISGNIINSSDEDGLHLLNSNGCLLVGNIVSKSCCGLRLESSHNNTLYLNSLRDNRDHNAYDDGINLWDNGQKGNYYHDYARSGDCNPSGYFCASPYPIPGGSSVDRYPLAKEEMGA